MKEWKEWKKELTLTRKNYCEDIICLDTETTSFEDDKTGYVYVWMVAINEDVFYGRTLKELQSFLFSINEVLGDKKAIIYIHNLGFEFQFLRNVFEFENVFAREQRAVMSCKIKDTNIELRCSMMLSGMSLDDTAKTYSLTRQKAVGALDYTLVRNCLTPLTEREKEYCEGDVLVMVEYIKMMVSEYGTIDNIPLTETGETRREFFEHLLSYCKSEKQKKWAIKNWKKEQSKMVPNLETFLDLCVMFWGAYVHSNAFHTNKTLFFVNSKDETSAYSGVMAGEKYPVGVFVDCEENLEDMNIDEYGYILKLRFRNIKATGLMTYISAHKCETISGMILDNGRVDCADELVITITEQDYEIIKRVYSFDDVEILKMKRAKKYYLPREYFEFVVKLYERKQKQKPFKDRSREDKILYERRKRSLNSLFGMAATKYIVDEVICKDEWKTKKLDTKAIEEKLNEQRNKEQVFLPFQYAVWITAYARRNLWEAILAIGDDVVYCDTDSVKYLGEHEDFFKEYNQRVQMKIKKACDFYEVDSHRVEGLGEWDDEKTADKFRTLGAKKYCAQYGDKLKLTLSGVSKEAGVEALGKIENFKNGFVFSKGIIGKKTRAYNDAQEKKTITDYLGNTVEVEEKFGVCIFEVDYKLNTSGDYIDYVSNAHCENLER